FISLAIVNASLRAKSSLGTKRVFSATSAQEIDDNVVHLLRLVRHANNITVFVDDNESMNFNVENRFDHPLLADSLVVGNVDRLGNEAFDTREFFKGTIQDLRINGRPVALTPVPPGLDVPQFGVRVAEENVIEGTVSDDVCSARNPCKKGSLPATFIVSSSAVYSLEGVTARLSSSMGNLSFALRTRSTSGQILNINSKGNSINVALDKGALVAEITFRAQLARIMVASAVNDGQWHNVTFNDRNVWFDDKSKRDIARALHMDFFLTESNTVLIIGRKDASSPSFDGCLSDVRVGLSAPLSFFENGKAGGFMNGSLRFEQSLRINLRDGCHSEVLCDAHDSPCKNGAICQDLWNLRNCKCLTGFAGDLCEENINDCEANSCVHGECIDGIAEFRCSCLPGYIGQYCDRKVDYCHPSPCLNGGSCISRNSSAVCTCATGFFGARCQQNVTATCANSPCENGARCIELKDSFSCECVGGFEGALCDTAINHCSDNPCRNGGQCTSTEDGFECLCALGYSGRVCDELKDECRKSPCAHGECRRIWNGFVCECEQGWTGSKCSIDVDECERFPCENGANCTNTEGSFSCSCPNYYLGTRCEIAGSCASLPCGDRGECIQLTATEHSCSCARGYTGASCEHEIDYCSSNPCLNGATCQRLIGGFKCICIAGFTGETCAVDIDDCVGDACKNGGRCTDRVNGFDCDCSGTGFEGARCERDIDECAIVVCVHGQCINLPGSYKCDCQLGYIGRKCNVEDPCLPDSLNRTRHSCLHGDCVQPVVVNENGRDVAKHGCNCYAGYTGVDCEQIQQRHRLALL
uniref:CRUMBS n=1 Tax=Parascaris univalens TaxID=6257 RepID=A0A915ATS3_PARUN